MHRNLERCIRDLEAAGELARCNDPVDAKLEVAEIHRRVYRSGGPAVLFTNVLNCRFPMVSNLFGTRKRVHYLFRHSLDRVRRLIELKIDPTAALRNLWKYKGAPFTALHMLPRRVRRGAVLAHECSLRDLPQLVSWPNDGGGFITLPLVYTEHPGQPGLSHSNLGMYRIQISGGQYAADEAGMHYQIHRGIGVHHAAALQRGEPLRVNVFVGGTPAMSVAAVMPLPEGLSELGFAGALAGHRIPMIARGGELPMYAEADFCLVGTVDPGRKLPEGPFGDHLGYYSLAHDFPVLRVERVYHREGAIWPFTVVGRPPQEDTMFGELIHEITGPVIPTVVHGVRAVNAVDAAGVHPLMLALGSERYVPYEPRTQPQEILTQACAILGQGQMSLAKYLFIAAGEDDPQLDIRNIPAFFAHVLRRCDWRRDLHFFTRTTIDTLDYSGAALNAGSKLIVAAAGPPIRELPTELPGDLRLPEGAGNPRLAMPGILCVESTEPNVARFCAAFSERDAINAFPLVVLVDDAEFSARSLNNWLWVTFTRSNPAADVHGIGEFTEQKHWGCRGSLVIDARVKPHHAPPLVEDPVVSRRVDALAARGGALGRWL